MEDVWFLKSSQAVQNSMFSSQNSDLRKMQKAAFPSVAGEGGREGRRERSVKDEGCIAVCPFRLSKLSAKPLQPVLLRPINCFH